jgi:hypothetical protein
MVSMGKVIKSDKRVRIIVDEELRWQLKAEAVKQKISMQALVNKYVKDGLRKKEKGEAK